MGAYPRKSYVARRSGNRLWGDIGGDGNPAMPQRG